MTRLVANYTWVNVFACNGKRNGSLPGRTSQTVAGQFQSHQRLTCGIAQVPSLEQLISANQQTRKGSYADQKCKPTDPSNRKTCQRYRGNERVLPPEGINASP